MHQVFGRERVAAIDRRLDVRGRQVVPRSLAERQEPGHRGPIRSFVSPGKHARIAQQVRPRDRSGAVVEEPLQALSVEIRFRRRENRLFVENEGAAALLEQPGERRAGEDPLAGADPHVVTSATRAVNVEAAANFDQHDDGLGAVGSREALLP